MSQPLSLPFVGYWLALPDHCQHDNAHDRNDECGRTPYTMIS